MSVVLYIVMVLIYIIRFINQKCYQLSYDNKFDF